jgi:biopolymer transport protein ExbD
MKLLEKPPKKVVLSLTPLIDVLFILIIFFTVSSTFLEQPGIELKLPDAESSETHTTQKVVIYINNDGALFVNDQAVTMENLSGQVASLLEETEDKSVVLRADEQVPHGTIIRLMDLCRRDGIYKIVVSTNKPVGKN